MRAPADRPWRPRRPLPDAEARAAALAAALGLRPLTARVLVARGLEDPAAARAFLAAGRQDLVSPFLFPDMERAVARLRAAARRGERVAVYGDYDADGICAAAIAAGALERLCGAPPLVYIPHRLEEGYGLRAEALERLAAAGVRVVVTVDTGVAALRELEHAARLGLDVVVTDHHEPGSRWPPGVPVLHPRDPRGGYPCPWLPGAGVAFKLARALLEDDGDGDLQLVAVAAVADVMPLTGENRALVRLGLERLRSRPRPGLRALCQVAGVDPARLTAWHLGYVIGPRLNAAGRVGDPRLAYALLRADPERAERLARRLEAENRRRQQLQEAVLREAWAQVAALGDRPVYLLAAPGWHPGVVGVVAGKLAEALDRPVLVAAEEDGLLRGSARSVPELDITRALAAAEEHLEAYGGHAQAAGFTLRAERREAFLRRLEEVVAPALAARPGPALEYDCTARPSELADPGLLGELEALEPHGEGNPPPCVRLEAVEVCAARVVGGDGSHLRLLLRDAGGGEPAVPAIAFGQAELAPALADGACVDLLVTPVRSSWQGEERVELRVEALRPRPRPRVVLRGAREAAAAGEPDALLEAARLAGDLPDRGALVALYRALRRLLGAGPLPRERLAAALGRERVPLGPAGVRLGLRIFAELGLVAEGPDGIRLAEAGRRSLEESPTFQACRRLRQEAGGTP